MFLVKATTAITLSILLIAAGVTAAFIGAGIVPASRQDTGSETCPQADASNCIACTHSGEPPFCEETGGDLGVADVVLDGCVGFLLTTPVDIETMRDRVPPGYTVSAAAGLFLEATIYVQDCQEALMGNLTLGPVQIVAVGVDVQPDNSSQSGGNWQFYNFEFFTNSSQLVDSMNASGYNATSGGWIQETPSLGMTRITIQAKDQSEPHYIIEGADQAVVHDPPVPNAIRWHQDPVGPHYFDIAGGFRQPTIGTVGTFESLQGALHNAGAGPTAGITPSALENGEITYSI